MQKLLRGFGAVSFGCKEDFEHGEVIVQFEHRERQVVSKASSTGYARAWLKEHPYRYRSNGLTADAHTRKALKIGQTAVYSILRDWIKGQVTAVKVGMLSFEGAFLGQILLPNEQTVMEQVERQNILRVGRRHAEAAE